MAKRKIYRKLVSVDEVIPALEAQRPLRPLGELEVPLSEALGRVLSRNVYARVNYPPYARALMDGYAVMSDDLAGVYEDRPRRLKLVGRVSAGESKIVSLARGECVEVSTGAAIPYPADAVVPVEYTSAWDGFVIFYRSVAKGENVDQAGSDFSEGEVVAWRGEVVTPPLASTLAALGVDKVYIYRPVKVGILPTGNELRPPGEHLDYGCVYESNSYLVYGYAKLAGAIPKLYERALDDERDLEGKLWRALEENDLVVTIGGTSAGREDLVYRVLSSLNPGIIVHGVKEKPGRPLALALHGDKIIMSLPGFPLSCFLTVILYLLPILARLQGARAYEYARVSARVPVPLRGEPGVRVFVPVMLVEREGLTTAYPLPGHSSKVSSLSLVDGYVIVPEDVECAPAGCELEVLVSPFWKPYDVNIVGSHDPLLQQIVSVIASTESVRMLNMGSMSGLHAIKMGAADVAGIHLLDRETKEYNVPFIKRASLKGVLLVRGYLREQGFVYRRGAAEASSMGDVIDRGLRFVNRNPGSGTRVLIDMLLEQEAERRGVEVEELKSMVKGYNFEVRTHEAVAYLVSRGVVDVGLAVRYVAEKYDLGFVPIGRERYDLLIRRDSLNKRLIKHLVDRFGDLVKLLIKNFQGYELDEETGRRVEF
ncbi:MAG: molybdopterin biosynthesis protein [Candidatus Nezhaarchaeales archaeon]